MKLMLRLGLTAVFFGVAQWVGAQEKPTLHHFDLDECIQYALEHNENIKNTNLSMVSAKARVGETLADGLPQIDGAIDLSHNFEIPSTILPAEALDPNTTEEGSVAVQFSTAYVGDANISLRQMIFDGSYFVGLQAAKTYQELSRKDHIKSQIDVIEAVKKAYYSVLVTNEQMDLVRKNYARTDSLLNETRLMYENGFAEKIDVSRIKVEFNNLTVEKDNIEQTMAISYILLKFQMGMPTGEELLLKDNIENVEFEVLKEEIGTGFRMEDRIEYAQLQTNKALVELDIKNNNVQYLPKLDLYGSLGANTGTEEASELFDVGNNWFSYGIVGVNMSVPIFDGFRKGKRIQQKKIERDQIDNQFDLLENQINVEIEESKANYKKSVENMSAQKENMTLAEEIYTVTKIKYQEGIGSNLEVIEADTSYKQAQTNYYGALYDALVAKIELEKAYGKLLGNNYIK